MFLAGQLHRPPPSTCGPSRSSEPWEGTFLRTRAHELQLAAAPKMLMIHTSATTGLLLVALHAATVRAQTCTTQADFARETEGLNAACCANPENCAGGLPTACSRQCAQVLAPVRSRCHAYLDQPANFPIKSILDTTAGTCRDKGCGATIDADGLAATRCADTRHGSTCTSSCRDGFVLDPGGGGHRRAQSSEITFTCSSNTDGTLNADGMQATDRWNPIQPFSCVSVGPPSERALPCSVCLNHPHSELTQ